MGVAIDKKGWSAIEHKGLHFTVQRSPMTKSIKLEKNESDTYYPTRQEFFIMRHFNYLFIVFYSNNWSVEAIVYKYLL